MYVIVGVGDGVAILMYIVKKELKRMMKKKRMIKRMIKSKEDDTELENKNSSVCVVKGERFYELSYIINKGLLLIDYLLDTRLSYIITSNNTK